MNNLLIQLAERDYREENLLKYRNIPGKKTKHKPIWNLVNLLPSLPGIELLYHTKMIKN